MPRWAGDLSIMVATFAVVTGLAELLGATNLGTAMAFGQMGFALAVVYVLVRR
jgi:hypothetical protein